MARTDPVQARSLEGKLGIITGASRGIGAAIAENLASKGANVVINFTSDSSKPIAVAMATKLQDTYGIRAIIAQGNVATQAGASDLINIAKSAFSDTNTDAFQVDIVINNAGVGTFSPLGTIDLEHFNHITGVNQLGPIFTMQAVLPYLPHDRSGRIVNISSIAATIPMAGSTVYSGTKAALHAYTRVWSRELAERATVNVVNPGPVATDLLNSVSNLETEKIVRPILLNTPLAQVREGVDDDSMLQYAKGSGGRPAYAHEVAGIVGMLCTKDAAWCTGGTVNANGGATY